MKITCECELCSCEFEADPKEFDSFEEMRGALIFDLEDGCEEIRKEVEAYQPNVTYTTYEKTIIPIDDLPVDEPINRGWRLRPKGTHSQWREED